MDVFEVSPSNRVVALRLARTHSINRSRDRRDFYTHHHNFLDIDLEEVIESIIHTDASRVSMLCRLTINPMKL